MMSAISGAGFLNLPLDIVQIRGLLPHRPPFLFVDRVIELEPGVRGIGLKNVTYNESYLAGHFPEQPIMPGVLIVEACAQLAAIVMATVALKADDGVGIHERPRTGYLASINRFKLMTIVVPGDQLRLDVQIGKRVGNLLQVRAEVRSDEKREVANGEIAVSIPEGVIHG
jgi:3-hydroxyacyl-[acyl-carrier-protein] dehydratase